MSPILGIKKRVIIAMETPTVPLVKSLSEREGQYFRVATRLGIAAIMILVAFGIVWIAVSSHEPEFGRLAGWPTVPALWALSSAYRHWKAVPASDRINPQLRRGRIVTRIALSVLLAVVAATALAIVIPVAQRQVRSRRFKQLLEQANEGIPAVTQNRLNVQAIMRRDIKNFATFRTQCLDLQVALQEADALAIKKKQLWSQLERETDDPKTLSLLELYKQIGSEDEKGMAALHQVISCSEVLARSDASQQSKFISLCVAPALSELEVSETNETKLLKEAQERGATLPPDLLESLR